MVGRSFVIKTFCIARNRKELDQFAPSQFPCVVKPTHLSGKCVILFDRSFLLDKDAIAPWFNINHYVRSREQNYRHLSPKVIVEEFFSEDGVTVPKDYKIFCVKGVPKFVLVDSDRFSRHTRNLYDMTWSRIPVSLGHSCGDIDDARPKLFDEMICAARKIAKAFPFVRVDMYATPTEIRIGELTFVPGSAGSICRPSDGEITLGSYFLSH